MKNEIKVKPYVRPETDIVPLNGRIYCDKILRVSKETGAGIYLPASYFLDDEQGNATIEIRQNRFFVVAIAPDVLLEVPDGNGNLRKLRPGDEVVPQDNPDAIGWSLPIVRDYDQEIVHMFYVLHETEIFGIAPEDPEVMIEDDTFDLKIEGDAPSLENE